jgi:hypothetical protein
VISMERLGSRMVAEDISPQSAGELPQLALISGFRKYTS